MAMVESSMSANPGTAMPRPPPAPSAASSGLSKDDASNGSREMSNSTDVLGAHREFFGNASVTNFTALIVKGLALPPVDLEKDEDATPKDDESQQTQNGQGRQSRSRRTLPHPEQAKAILQVYFKNQHQLYPFIHENTFKRDYARLYDNLAAELPEQSFYPGETVLDLTGASLSPDQELHVSLIEAVLAMVEKIVHGGFINDPEAADATRNIRGHCELDR
jgi:hypothetical protein